MLPIALFYQNSASLNKQGGRWRKKEMEGEILGDEGSGEQGKAAFVLKYPLVC